MAKSGEEDFAMARSPLAPLLLLPLALALSACPGRNGGNASADSAANSAGGSGTANSAEAADSAFAADATGQVGSPGKAGTGKSARGTGGGVAAGETLLASETVKARFDGFLGGHSMDAKLGGPGYRGPKRAAVQSAPVAAFLHVHRGETLTLKLDTVRQPDRAEPESSPPVTVVRIASARAGAAASDSYWKTLSAEEKDCAARSLDGAGSPCNGEEAVRKQGERG